MFREEIIKALKNATKEKKIHLELPEQEGHGDYSSNIAMQLFSQFPISNFQFPIEEIKNPRQLAERIVLELQKDRNLAKIIEKIEVAGPGFINFFLKEEFLLKELKQVNAKGNDYGKSNIGKGKTVLVEYSSPNIAKYFGIGHLRSTIIGQALYNIYKFLGYKVVGDNHLGDWGTQFGMIIAQVVRKKLDPRSLTISDYERLYVEFNKEVEDKPKLRDEAKKWFKKLERGDKEAEKIWKMAVKTSMDEFERIYNLLGVKIDHAYGESFYQEKIPDVIDEVRKKNLSKKSKGAEIIELKGIPPAMLLKSDGATTYYTRDLATVKFRMDKFKPDLIIYEVGADQKLHFQQVFLTAEKMGWINSTKLVHVAHGLIRFEHGKMSTRKGETIKLEDVLTEAIDRARKIIEKSETSRGLSKSERERVAIAVGIGAVKYFDLSHRPESEIIFDWEKMFVLEGNSAPYLQYTFARTQSVLRKTKQPINQLTNQRINKEELSVLRTLPKFSEVIQQAAENYAPNLLCNYLFDLAQKFNHFYNKHKIIGSKEQGIRLALTSATGQVLKNGLTLLGIEVPEKM